MIDIKNIESEFDKYVKRFNINDDKIKLKIEHIKRVADISRMIAKNLNLNEEYIRLAETIGYFHDIGRFKQVEDFNTFSDKDSIDHAEYSVKVLFEDNLIENFKVEEKYRNIIKVAVLNHNKNKIEEGLNEEELLFARIVRDADKLDIYYTICNYDFESVFWYGDFDCDKISEQIMYQFTDLHSVNYADIKNNADQILAFFAFIYDFNFKFSLEYLKEKRYLEQFSKRICKNFSSEKITKQMEEILKISNEYLDSKIH